MAQQDFPELTDLRDQIESHVASLKVLLSELMKRQGVRNQATEMTVEVRGTMNEPVSSGDREWCYWRHYVGGHMADGTPYYVVERVCLEVEGMGEA
jgi:hypothetical protein